MRMVSAGQEIVLTVVEVLSTLPPPLAQRWRINTAARGHRRLEEKYGLLY